MKARACAGVELGFGAELSLIVLIFPAGRPTDYKGESILIELELPLPGLAIGGAVGFLQNSDVPGNPPHWEVTLGAGGGGGIGGSYCWSFL